MRTIILLLACLLSFSSHTLLSSTEIPRRVIAFWDSLSDLIVDDSRVHRTIEMPLNYLGLDVIYYDIQNPLPDLAKLEGIRGIVLCFKDSARMPDPTAFLEWTLDAIDKGKKIVIMQNPGFLADLKGNFTSNDLQNKLFQRLGFTNTQQWIEYPFEYQILWSDKTLYPFEQKIPFPMPGFYVTKIYDPAATSYLSVGIPGQPETKADLIVMNQNGAFVSQFFSNSFDALLFTSNPRSLGWYINPFAFFRKVFEIDTLPIPDATTLAGRRIYFATCHGDSWNTETSLEEYKNQGVICADVILNKIILPNPDLPIAVGIVAADLDPTWAGKPISQEVASKYLLTPQVEAASHTYSHPFYWDFFRTDADLKEIDYLYLYPYGSWQSSFLSWFKAKAYQKWNPKEYKKTRLKWGYAIPRAYANEPFNLNKEIAGAVEYINQFAPDNNKLKLLIWSGDSRPWDTAVELTQKAGIRNYGGGYVRFDPEHPSNLFVYPLGRKPGGIIQLYAVTNGENDYTEEWQGPFYGYQFLPATLKNTESPRRLKPIQLYFHSYSGQFKESINAILSNIAYIRTQPFIPITVARYCEIGEGFFSVSVESLAKNRWKFHNRKGLDTIRFDEAEKMHVDFAASTGIVGWMRLQGSLYTYLDAAVKEPVVALSETLAENEVSYLIESTWEVWNVQRNGTHLSFIAKGWGQAVMQWKVPQEGTYLITVEGIAPFKAKAGENKILTIAADAPYNQPIKIGIGPVL